ncbi:MAG: hypothetical protein M1826_002462 [Phylliscum demangeonii]|nr:MAG: hypothetical protein M1826_002462 [Phylliscum demangeonii]
MKFVHYLFPVCAFIVGSVSLYIPPGQLERNSRELSRSNPFSTFRDGADKKKSWPLPVVEPRVKQHPILAKRTTDEESLKRQEDVDRQTSPRKGPIVYTAEQLATYEEQYNAAKRASDSLQSKVQRAKVAGREVSQDDEHELSRLNAVTYEQEWVLTRARQGKSLDRRTRQDVASLAQDPTIQELAKSGPYDAQQLAEYKLGLLDAGRELRLRKKQLGGIAEVRELRKAEEQELVDLQRAFNLRRKIWNRVRQGKPATHRVNPPKQSIDDLLESPKLHEKARSSGYSVKELAEAKRRYLDAFVAFRLYRSEHPEDQRVRLATDAEKTQLQALWETVKLQKRIFERMSRGRAADGDPAVPRKDLTFLLKDPEVLRIAQMAGYSVEEVAVQKRGYLDAKYKYIEAQKLISAVKKRGGRLTPDDEERFLKIDKAYQLQKTGWDRMNKGEPADSATQSAATLGRLGKDVAALRRKAKVDELAPPSITYTPQQITKYDQRYLDALQELEAFQDKVAIAMQSGRPITVKEKNQLKILVDAHDQRMTELARVRQGLFVSSLGDDPKAVTYTADEIDGYNDLHLDALRKFRGFEREMAAAREAGRPPTADDDARLRALREDFNKKKTMWNRARSGKPVDRKVYTSRARSFPKSARAQDIRPGSQEQPIKARTDADHPTNQSLQMSGHRLFAPVLTSATRFLRGLSRQWGAMPWIRYLANRRSNIVKPAALLRAESAP